MIETKKFYNMNKLIKILAALSLLAASCHALGAQTPRAEYPRPQFEREAWVNLNGEWTYSFDAGRSGEAKGWVSSQGFDGKIIVPFCPESSLSGVAHTDFINRIWYQRTISVPASWDGKTILLHFGASDYRTSVYVNSKLVGEHVGTGSSFTFDISSAVKAGEQANLVVKVDDDLRSGLQPGGKQCTELMSSGCSYTRTTGIWQTVWMEAVDSAALKEVFATPDIDQSRLVIRPSFYKESMGNTLEVSVMDGKKVVATESVQATNNNFVVLNIKKMKLWSPDDPFLYDIVYRVKDASGKVIDEVKSYAGMRKVHIQDGYFYLNNKPFFQRLVLDQGFYPDGIWTAPSDEALRRDIEMSMAAGFNGARLHQKEFEERFFYWADKLGYLTWAEFPNWDMDINNEQAARNFISEWSEMVVRDRNHPSIVTWTPSNETWGCRPGVYVRLMNDLYDITKSIDPTRPVNDASGDGHVKTDIWTVHDYSRDYDALVKNHTITAGVEPYRNQPEKKFLACYAGQPYMVDEFGGLPWIKPENRAGSWGYGSNIDELEEFYSILEKQVDALAACKYVVGFCYTQLTDVEQEKNGIYFYNRELKFDMERIRKIFEKIPSWIENPADLSDWK